MTLIVDTAPIVVLADRRDPRQQDVHAVLRNEHGPLVVPAPVTAEVDYFMQNRHGRAAELAFLRDLAAGRYEVACLEPPDYRLLAALAERYRDLGPGLADLSIVVLAARYDTRRILTFDYRHFRALEPIQGGEFELLPA